MSDWDNWEFDSLNEAIGFIKAYEKDLKKAEALAASRLELLEAVIEDDDRQPAGEGISGELIERIRKELCTPVEELGDG